LYNVGDRGDPCGVPAGVVILSDVAPLNRSLVLLPFRKLPIQFVRCLGTHLLRMLCMRRSWCTLLNAPATSMNTAVNISPCFHASCIFSDNIISASSEFLLGFP